MPEVMLSENGNARVNVEDMSYEVKTLGAFLPIASGLCRLHELVRAWLGTKYWNNKYCVILCEIQQLEELRERIGTVLAAMRERAITSHVTHRKFRSPNIEPPTESEESCCICLVRISGFMSYNLTARTRII